MTGLKIYTDTGWIDVSETAASILAKLLTVDGAGSGLDADLLDGLHASEIVNFALVVDTRAIILASVPTVATIAISNDNLASPEFYFYDLVAWKRMAIPLGLPSTGVDMGAIPYNDDNGYGELNLSDKDLHNVVLKGFNTDSRAAQEGALRKTALTATTNAIQVYVNGSWRSFLVYTAAQEDAIMLWTDGWTSRDVFGRNIIQGGTVDQGVFAADMFIDGGVISDETP